MAELKIRWWQWLPLWRWRVLGFVDSADEVPHLLPRNSVILVGASARLKWIVFDCPCRSGHRIMLNGDPKRRPFWRVTSIDRITVTPSIDFHGERRCHYFLREGRVVWAR